VDYFTKRLATQTSHRMVVRVINDNFKGIPKQTVVA